MEQLRHKKRAAEFAAVQAGRITFAQLRALGLSLGQIRVWERTSGLHHTVPRVYAVGYVRTDLAARLWEAVLYAGPGACLSGAAGAHHCNLIKRTPTSITISTPRQCRSRPGIWIRSQRDSRRRLVDGLPVAPLDELLLDLATEVDDTELRFALGNLEFRRQLDVAALLEACRRGRPGSRQLRHALARRLPQLARTKSKNEVAFLLLLEAHHLPLPQVNVRVHGIEVDCYYPDLGLVVEIDTEANHGTAAQQRRDAENAAKLRGYGLAVIRLSDIDIGYRVPETLAILADHGVR